EAKKDAAKVDERDEARGDYLQARLYLGGVAYEIGKTYEPQSKEFKDHLTKAAKNYGELYETYGDRGYGLYAHMLEGRAYKELGDTEKAIAVLKQMLTLAGEDDAGRILKVQSLALLLEAYLHPKAKKYAEALAEAGSWQKTARGAEESSSDGLKIRFLAGRAAFSLAEGLKEDDPTRRDSLRAARQHFEFVGRFRGEFQREAKELLAHELLGGDLDVGEPKTFAEAKDRADFAWGTMVIADGSLRQATTPEDQKKITDETNQSRDEALAYYRMALAMATDEAQLPEVNGIRFRLTYLYWIQQDFYRAAVMGEFLASHYPQSVGARQGAEIAVKAYRTLYSLSPERKENRTFETRRMNEVANLITTRWPGEPVANEAWLMLLDTAVDNRDLAKTEEYLAKVAEDSPRRAQAELRAGQAIWASYVEESNKPEEERPPQEKLDELIAKAQETLEQGVARMRKRVDGGGSVDYALVYSVLSVAQIYIGAGKSEEAVKWLDDPKIGPMTLVAAGHTATDKENFRIETYKAALRAYVGAQELDKAEEAMDALETMIAAGGDAATAGKLTEIYIMLGRELQETLKRLRQENKNDEAEKVAGGFEVFLSRISKREKGNTFNSLNWVAETFYNLGASLDPDGQETPEKAKDYYKEAATTYVKILKKIKEQKQPPPSDFRPAIEQVVAIFTKINEDKQVPPSHSRAAIEQVRATLTKINEDKQVPPSHFRAAIEQSVGILTKITEDKDVPPGPLTASVNQSVVILIKIKEDSAPFAPSGAATNIQVRLAACLRALNQHAEAMKFLLNILNESERRVDVQIEAARTYQDWAKLEGKSGYYNFAIKGGNKVGDRYLVWGWGGVARRVAPYDKYQSTFHEARYNLALCRLKYAQSQQGAEKADTLEMAEKDILSTQLLYPTMGGDEWYPKYDALLKNIQRLRGVKRPAGLEGRAKKSAQTKTTTRSTTTASR
ncbi:MAG: hypothetical protein ABIP48_10080, partial [Planctomycetota bacterium]